MRLLLDAQISARAIGRPLRAAGHDVLALSEERDLEDLPDADVLGLAAREQRIVVTFNVRDFARILDDWGAQSRDHCGCILITGIRNSEFGRILRGLEGAFARRPEQDAWSNVATYLNSSSM